MYNVVVKGWVAVFEPDDVTKFLTKLPRTNSIPGSGAKNLLETRICNQIFDIATKN